MAKLFPMLRSAVYGRIDALREAGVQTIAIGLPWAMMQPHEKQALANHAQSLSRLADRGGLSPAEAVAVLEDRPFHHMGLADAEWSLIKLLTAYHKANGDD